MQWVYLETGSMDNVIGYFFWAKSCFIVFKICLIDQLTVAFLFDMTFECLFLWPKERNETMVVRFLSYQESFAGSLGMQKTDHFKIINSWI